MSEPKNERVLIVAPVGRDAPLLARLLHEAGLQSTACTDAGELARALREGAGSLILTEEALMPAIVDAITSASAAQPAWSDLSVVLLVDPEPGVPGRGQRVAALDASTSLVVLERPVRALPLISAVQAMLRVRRRQYEIRDLVASEKAARETAEHASRVKDEFLATVSHELRTPLTAILLWVRLLESGGIDESKTRQALEAVARSAAAQSKLIEDLLDVSRMITGKLKLSVRALDLAPIASAAIEVIRPAAEAKGIAVEAAVDRDAFVQGDPARLEQVLWNLLSNAVKFTPGGGRIALRVMRAPSCVRISVADTGRGIPASFLPYVFDRFRQADASLTRREGGLGLGLAIGRELVELHGGTIRADSSGEGRGAVFTIELPLFGPPPIRAATESVSPPDAGFLAGIRVLLVEDEPATREALALTLEARGAEVVTVESAAAALDVLGRGPPSDRPDVLLSDLGLPGSSGYELLRESRAREVLRGESPIPAALLTAYAGDAEREKAFEAGFAAHLVKPVEPARLAAIVRELARGDGMKQDRGDGPQTAT